MIYLHITAGRDPIVTTDTLIAQFTSQCLAYIDGLVGPFETTDDAARWAERNGTVLCHY